jgi:cytochrome c556
MKAERPQAEKDLSDTKSRLAKAEAKRTNLVNLLSQNNAQVPESLWADVRGIDQETQTLRAEVERLTAEIATWQNQAPDVERFRAGLAGLADNFKKIPADQQYKLLRSVIDSLHVDQDGDAWQRAMDEGAKRKRAREKVRGPSKWLRLLGSNQRPADERSAACFKSLVRRKNRIYS